MAELVSRSPDAPPHGLPGAIAMATELFDGLSLHERATIIFENSSYKWRLLGQGA